MADALNPAIFTRGAMRAEAASIEAGKTPDGANPSNSNTAGDALVTDSAAQNTQVENPAVGAQGSGSDPLINKPADESVQTEEKTIVENPIDGSVDGETVEGEPDANADLKSVREWGRGLDRDLKSVKPVVEQVMQLGGIDKLKVSANLYDAFASPDFSAEEVLSALNEMSEPRYLEIVKTAFTNHEDMFLEALGLNPMQFKIAAKAVMQGTPVTADDLASAEIPFGLSPEAWDAIPEAEQDQLLTQAKAKKEQDQRIAQAEQQRKRQEAQAAQTEWAGGLDKLIIEACDTLKLPADEEGNKLREKIRRNVWAAASSDPRAAEHFYASMGHFQKGEVGFANARKATLENFFREVATEEAQYYSENTRLKNEIAQLKLSRTGERKEIGGGDAKENLSVNTGNNGNGIDLENLFNKKTLKDEANQLRPR